jgi:HEAT repeat protein
MAAPARLKCGKTTITVAVLACSLLPGTAFTAEKAPKPEDNQKQNSSEPSASSTSQSDPAPQTSSAPETAPTGSPSSTSSSPTGASRTITSPHTAEKPLPIRERAWKELEGGLKENSAEKRAKAVNALALLTGNPDAENDAIEALTDGKDNVRMAAATALGTMHASRAVPQLERALDDDEPGVVLAAANSLMLLKDNRAYDVYYDVLTGNTRSSKGFVKEQLKPFHDPKKVAAIGVEEGIGFVPFGGIGYEVIKRVLKSSNDASLVRAAAAKKLAHDPSAQSAEALVDATQDKSWIVRAAAFDAIAQRGDKALVPEISGSLKDNRDDVRYMAAACIVHLKDIGVKRRTNPRNPQATPAKMVAVQTATR